METLVLFIFSFIIFLNWYLCFPNFVNEEIKKRSPLGIWSEDGFLTIWPETRDVIIVDYIGPLKWVFFVGWGFFMNVTMVVLNGIRPEDGFLVSLGLIFLSFCLASFFGMVYIFNRFYGKDETIN